ncbi:MAG: orotidine-5'-phosphate decarboxylase [Clostridia bacterium]
MIIDSLIERIIKTNNPTAVGLDTCVDYLPQSMQDKIATLEDAGKFITEFNCNLIDAIKNLVPAVKVQVAYYEMYGVAGMKAFSDTIKYAKANGLMVIADVKRNDIGATAGAYSRAYISGTTIAGKKFTPFESDFITVNGYLGSDGILPFVNDCKMCDKGLFVLVKTSNKSSGELQNLTLQNGATLYEQMASLVQTWGSGLIGKYGFSSIGAVVGATHKEEAQRIRQANPSTFFLIPGYGAQGGTAEDLKVCFNKQGLGGIVNSSRGILCAYKQEKYKGQDYITASVNAVYDMQKDLEIAIKGE